MCYWDGRIGYQVSVINLPRRPRANACSPHPHIYPGFMDVVGDVRIEPAEEGVAVVVLTGEHDLGSLPRVRDAFDAVAGEGKSLIVDLCPTSFVDSSILGAILDARRTATDAARGFAVACDGSAEPVRRVLEVTGLGKELPVLPSREAALAGLGGQGRA